MEKVRQREFELSCLVLQNLHNLVCLKYSLRPYSHPIKRIAGRHKTSRRTLDICVALNVMKIVQSPLHLIDRIAPLSINKQYPEVYGEI